MNRKTLNIDTESHIPFEMSAQLRMPTDRRLKISCFYRCGLTVSICLSLSVQLNCNKSANEKENFMVRQHVFPWQNSIINITTMNSQQPTTGCCVKQNTKWLIRLVICIWLCAVRARAQWKMRFAVVTPSTSSKTQYATQKCIYIIKLWILWTGEAASGADLSLSFSQFGWNVFAQSLEQKKKTYHVSLISHRVDR